MSTVSLQSVFDTARQAIETGSADKAVGIAQHVLAHYPRAIEADRLLGEAYLNAGDPEQAAAAFERVLDADPENIAAYYGLGLARQSLDQRHEAIEAFEHALEIQPNLADLRAQLMRLYSETPGATGQIRLSRAGLGRLYARGGMHSQAIDEFRAVLDNDPQRTDVQVALAETLWRDGQEDEAADYCRDILAQHPDLLKPTVLLGYIQIASGQPEGEQLWQRAAEQDASLTIARSLFDIMPPIRVEEPVLPAFDEAEWRAQQARRSTQQPVAAPVPAVGGGDDDLFADSWLSSAGSASTGSVAASDTDDDLLASLLGFADEPMAPAAQPTQEEHAVEPFSFDDWDTTSGTQTPGYPQQATTIDDFSLDDQPTFAQPDQIDDVKPFSFDEMESARTYTAPETPESSVKPFSFDDFGFDEPVKPTAAQTDDLGVKPFSFDDFDEPEAPVTPASSTTDTQMSGIEPFSFEDETGQAFGTSQQATSDIKPFSLDDDDFGVEPFSFGEDTAPSAPQQSGQEPEPDVRPFSLDDWSLDDTNVPGASASQSGDLDTLQPFSLDDLSLDALDHETSPLAGLEDSNEEDSSTGTGGFKWQEPAWRSQQAQPRPEEPQSDDSIFAKLMRSRSSTSDTAAGEETPGTQQDEPSFFSIDDETLRVDDDSLLADLPTHQQPADLRSDALDRADSTAQLATNQPTDVFSLGAIEQGDDVFSWEQGDQPASSEEAATPFSLSELGLDDMPELSFDEPRSTEEAPSTQPFSLEDLDDQELPTFAMPSSGDEPILPFSLEEEDQPAPLAASADQAIEQPVTPSTNEEMSNEPKPFSLDELGLSDEELGWLQGTADNITDESASEAEATGDQIGAEPSPFSLAELGLTDDEISALDLQDGGETESSTSGVAPSGQPDNQSFDMGSIVSSDTTDEEDLFAAWNRDDQETEATTTSGPEPRSDEPDLSPFSLADLGLTDDEIAQIEQSPFDTTPANSFDTHEDEETATTPAEAHGPDVEQPTPVGEQGTSETEQPIEAVNPQADETSEPTPFTIADLGLSDEELAIFEQTRHGEIVEESDQQAATDALVPDAGTSDADPGAWGIFDEPAEQPVEASAELEATDESQAYISEASTEAANELPTDLELPAIADTPGTAAQTAPAEAQSDAPGMGSDLPLANFYAQLESDPTNEGLRLAVARMAYRINDPHAFDHYRQLIRGGHLLDDVVADVEDAIDEESDPQLLRRLHRLLGDAYMKQNRFREAMDHYSWTLSRQA